MKNYLAISINEWTSYVVNSRNARFTRPVLHTHFNLHITWLYSLRWAFYNFTICIFAVFLSQRNLWKHYVFSCNMYLFVFACVPHVEPTIYEGHICVESHIFKCSCIQCLFFYLLICFKVPKCDNIKVCEYEQQRAPFAKVLHGQADIQCTKAAIVCRPKWFNRSLKAERVGELKILVESRFQTRTTWKWQLAKHCLYCNIFCQAETDVHLD